jgi:hypothetical protein
MEHQVMYLHLMELALLHLGKLVERLLHQARGRRLLRLHILPADLPHLLQLKQDIMKKLVIMLQYLSTLFLERLTQRLIGLSLI